LSEQQFHVKDNKCQFLYWLWCSRL
jgi:hypothetical protein